MLHRLSVLCAVAVLAVALMAAPSTTAAPACNSAGAKPSTVAKRIAVRATLCTLNAERARYGIRSLKLNKRLSRAARGHARDMVRRDYFGHGTLGGGTFVDRIRRTGYLRGARSWTLGENLAWGTYGGATPQVITAMWMGSAGHRANILNASFREVGIGLVLGAPGANGPGATYATEFGVKG
jgi:uncharacterized protein YkwD